MAFTTILGSNNLTLPVQARVKERLKELKEIGKPRFQKGEDREWNEIPATMPIVGMVDWLSCVRTTGDDSYTITYHTYKTKDDEYGIPRVVSVLQKAGPGDMGTMEKLIEYRVVETFQKGRPFTVQREKYAGNPVHEVSRNKEFRKQRQLLAAGGDEKPTDETG